jgi:hypothetical protein
MAPLVVSVLLLLTACRSKEVQEASTPKAEAAPASTARQILGSWELDGGREQIEFSDKDEFVASLYGPCPPILRAEGLEQGTDMDLVTGTFSCTPEYTPMEKDSSGEYHPGPPVGKLEMTGRYRIKEPMVIEAFYRVKVRQLESDLVVFEASYQAGTLTVRSKAISISGGAFLRRGPERGK